MGWPSSFFLVCLLTGCGGAESESVDGNTLARIISFFDNHYKKVNENGDVHQYAVAINVPKEQCEKNFFPTNDNFLTKEEAETVKDNIYDPENALYNGIELIAAGTLEKTLKSPKKKYTRHSESILMNPTKTSPFTNLLNTKKDSCMVFYTYNSPCVNTCIDINGKYSILEMLERWSKHSSLKAFVFKNIWKFDKEKDLKSKFKEITKYVPLYRYTETIYRCDEPLDDINLNCLA